MIDIPVKNIYIHQTLNEPIDLFLKGVVLPPGFHYIVEKLCDSDSEALEEDIKELNSGNRDIAYINGLNPIRTLTIIGVVLYGAKFINSNNEIYWMNHEIAGTRLSRQKILHPDIITE